MRRIRWALLGALSVACGACTVTPPSAVVETSTPAATTTAPVSLVAPAPAALDLDSDSFKSVVDVITASLLTLQPELVTELGAGSLIGLDGNYLLSDLSPRGAETIGAVASEGFALLAAVDVQSLSDEEKVSAQILDWYLADVAAMAAYAQFESPVNFITGAHSNFGEFMADVHPIVTEADAEDYVDRLIAFGTQIDQMIEKLEASANLGIVPTDQSIGIARWQIGAAIGDGDAAQHPLVRDLADRVEAMPDESHSWAVGLVARAEAAVAGLVIPSLQDLDDAVRRLDGRSDQKPGVWAVPGGAEYYEAVLSHYLSVDLAPGEVHALGLEQVDRLIDELTLELEALGYAAGEDFVKALRQATADAGSMPTSNESERAAVLSRATTTVDEAVEVFANMFTLKPRTTLEVVRPRPGREGGSGAYYRPPPVDESRPGVYYLSLGGSEFDLLTMDTTTYHEAIPGHHFQLSVQRSLADLPLHQRAFDFTGYAEGWALYAERLAYEAGLYDDAPLGNIGRLRMELLRAARMVADTGLHWGKWSRDEAIDYLTGLGFETPMATSEVDRYVVWPGQAPSYMVGMLEILRLRDVAQAELGESFDLAGFHDALLSQGSVPVAMLQGVIDAWIAREQ